MKKSPKNENRLHPDNCNKAQCKTCIFGENSPHLPAERMAEILTYLAEGTASHICHTTNKTCFGALEFQAKIFFAMGVISEPSVESLLKTAGKALGLPAKLIDDENTQRNRRKR